MIYDKHEQFFQLLLSYLHIVQMSNHGSLTELYIGLDVSILTLFIALDYSRFMYTLCLRFVIIVDDMHLEDRNKGMLFVVVTKDESEQFSH